jgi:hypothetical protein
MQRSGLLHAERSDWERVASAVRQRRLDLGLTIREATKRVSLDVWGKIENARGPTPDATDWGYRPRTVVAVCQALGWTTDSLDRIIAGDPPVDDTGTSTAEEDFTLWLELVASLGRDLDHDGRAKALGYLEALHGGSGRKRRGA